jgi:hypothetical protein
MSTQSGFNMKAAASAPVKDAEGKGQWVELDDLDGTSLTYEIDGEVRPIRILVAGAYSKQYQDANDEVRGRMIKARRREVTGSQLTVNQREVAAACCLNWEGFFDGEAVFPCSKPNAIILFQARPDFQEQVEAAMMDHASFFRKTSGS